MLLHMFKDLEAELSKGGKTGIPNITKERISNLKSRCR